MMRTSRKRTALPRLEIRHVIAERAALQRQRRRPRLAEEREVDAEAAVDRLGAADRLEDQIDGRAALDQAERDGDMREHTGLCWHVKALA